VQARELLELSLDENWRLDRPPDLDGKDFHLSRNNRTQRSRGTRGDEHREVLAGSALTHGHQITHPARSKSLKEIIR
jgi:hypothetical protein